MINMLKYNIHKDPAFLCFAPITKKWMIPAVNVLFKWHHFSDFEALRFGFSSGKRDPKSKILR